MLLYNVPGRTAVDMLPATVARLARVPRIVGIKEAVGDAGARARARRHLRHPTSRCCPVTISPRATPSAVGAVGVISVTANVAPRAMADMVAAAVRGDRAGATQIDQRLVALHRNLFVESNPIPVKWAVARMGLIGGTLRLPLTALSAEYHAIVTESMFAAGIPGRELLKSRKVALPMRMPVILVAVFWPSPAARLQVGRSPAASRTTRTTRAPRRCRRSRRPRVSRRRIPAIH